MRCALRACRPGLRRSAGSTILRGSPSSTDRLPAPRFRCSRGPAQRALQSTPVVLLEVDMSSTRGRQSISGACCTLPPLLFRLTLVPCCRLQEAAYADGDLRWRAEQGGLQLGYQGDSWTLHALRPLISWSLVVCAICSHVSVDIVVVVYERGEVAGRSRVESFCATRDLESNLRLYTR